MGPVGFEPTNIVGTMRPHTGLPTTIESEEELFYCLYWVELKAPGEGFELKVQYPYKAGRQSQPEGFGASGTEQKVQISFCRV